MTAVVYDYPKSSCDCYCCECKVITAEGTGLPTNMSVRDCTTPKYYSCGNNLEFSSKVGPSDKLGINKLNPQVYSSNRAHDFEKTICKGSYCETSYRTGDPRLYNPIRWTSLELDHPPLSGTIPLRDVNTDENLNKYGQNYKEYGDVNAGQIMYYTDSSIEEPFFPPVFSTSANVTSYLYKDPMGAMKPHYKRNPLTCDNPITSSRCKGYEGGLSWMEDSNNHRDDIISLQMAKMNQTRWSPRWS
jgi:hypothetical protein